MKTLITKYFRIFFLYLTIIFIIITGFNSIHWNDDFNILSSINQNGFINYMLDFYFNWDGRSISPLFLIRNIILYYFPPQILSILALFSLFITSYFLYKLLVGVKAISISKSSYIIVSFLGIFPSGGSRCAFATRAGSRR